MENSTPVIYLSNMEKKLALEKDIIDVILSSELEAKQNIKLDEAAWKDINQETENFLDNIGFRILRK